MLQDPVHIGDHAELDELVDVVQRAAAEGPILPFSKNCSEDVFKAAMAALHSGF